MRTLLNLPMWALLSIKLWGFRKLLTMAEEQTQDALNLFCSSCSTDSSICERPQHCRLQRLRDREALLKNVILETEDRIARLVAL